LILDSPSQVSALLQPARWWSSEHTFSGSAANLTKGVDHVLGEQLERLRKLIEG
jgi:hypothetical protein